MFFQTCLREKLGSPFVVQPKVYGHLSKLSGVFCSLSLSVRNDTPYLSHVSFRTVRIHLPDLHDTDDDYTLAQGNLRFANMSIPIYISSMAPISHNHSNIVAEHGRPRIAERIVDVLVPAIMEEIVKVVKTVLQEQISERIRKQIVDVCVSQVVEQVAEVPKTSSRDRSLQCIAEQILDVPVPEMVKHVVEAPKTVPQDRIQQRTVEQIVDVPLPQAVEELAEVFRVFSQEMIQQRAVEPLTLLLLDSLR